MAAIYIYICIKILKYGTRYYTMYNAQSRFVHARVCRSYVCTSEGGHIMLTCMHSSV